MQGVFDLAVDIDKLFFGYYNEPIVYKFKDGSRESYLSTYMGWLLKYMYYIAKPTQRLVEDLNILYVYSLTRKD